MPEENKVEVQKKNWLDKFLDWLERVCNKLPDSIILFIYLFFIMVVLGCILGLLGVQAKNPATGAVVKVLNPISTDGLRYFVGNMVSNFTGFAPLGLVITMSLAIGLCEEGGLITSLLNDKLRNVPPAILPYVIAFVGTCGNIASDTAMVVIPPIAAVLYLGAGKNPIVGVINGYAGAQAGFSANLMIAVHRRRQEPVSRYHQRLCGRAGRLLGQPDDRRYRLPAAGRYQHQPEGFPGRHGHA